MADTTCPYWRELQLLLTSLRIEEKKKFIKDLKRELETSKCVGWGWAGLGLGSGSGLGLGVYCDCVSDSDLPSHGGCKLRLAIYNSTNLEKVGALEESITVLQGEVTDLTQHVTPRDQGYHPKI